MNVAFVMMIYQMTVSRTVMMSGAGMLPLIIVIIVLVELLAKQPVFRIAMVVGGVRLL